MTYYKKGYIIELIGGNVILATSINRVSYEQRVNLDQSVELVPFNTDYITYESPWTKYGLVPVASMKQLYEVKYKTKDSKYHVYNNLKKEIYILE